MKRPAAAKAQIQPAQAARAIRLQRARAEDMLLQEQRAALVERGHEHLLKRIHGSGFRVTVSRKRWTRAPRLECLCAGVGDKKGHQPRCNAVYTAEWSSTQHLFTVFEVGTGAVAPEPTMRACGAEAEWPVLAKLVRSEALTTTKDLVAFTNKYVQGALCIA